jgi:hypothetical protein
LLTNIDTQDWQSLTFAGERHQIQLRVTGAGADQAVGQICEGLEEAEFAIAGQIVADIAVAGEPVRGCDGSISVTIEALTVGE